MSRGHVFSILSGTRLGVGLLGHAATPRLLSEDRTDGFLRWLHHFTLPPARSEPSDFSPHLPFSVLFYLNSFFLDALVETLSRPSLSGALPSCCPQTLPALLALSPLLATAASPNPECTPAPSPLSPPQPPSCPSGDPTSRPPAPGDSSFPVLHSFLSFKAQVMSPLSLETSGLP